MLTLSIASRTFGLVISPLRNRFSINSTFVLPEHRHAIVVVSVA